LATFWHTVYIETMGSFNFRSLATVMSKSPVALTTKRSASESSWKSGNTSSGGDPVFQTTSGLGVPTTLHASDADCVSAIFTVGGGARIKLGASAVCVANPMSMSLSHL